MSILTELEDYLYSHPDEDLFELLYALGKFNLVVHDWDKSDNFNPDEEFEIVDDVLNDLYKDREWFQLKEGRYEKFLEYVHEHMLAYYNSIKEDSYAKDS